jgi:hypothetical protein
MENKIIILPCSFQQEILITFEEEKLIFHDLFPVEYVFWLWGEQYHLLKVY